MPEFGPLVISAGCDIQALQEIFGSHAVRLLQISCGLDCEGLRETGKRNLLAESILF